MKSEAQQRKDAMADISRASRARELIDNPLYVEAVTAMKAAMFEEFESSKLNDSDARHELWQRMQLLRQFQSRFESILKRGAKAKETLTLLDKTLNLFKVRNANNSR